MRTKVEMKCRKPEAIADYYLDKMLSESGQFRAYNEIHQEQKQTKRARELELLREKRGRLRVLQTESPINPIVHALSTFFGTKRSA